MLEAKLEDHEIDPVKYTFDVKNKTRFFPNLVAT